MHNHVCVKRCDQTSQRVIDSVWEEMVLIVRAGSMEERVGECGKLEERSERDRK